MKSKLMNSISAAAKAIVDRACNDMTETVSEIKGTFVLVGKDVVSGVEGIEQGVISGGKTIKNGVIGATTEVYNILADVAEIIGTGSQSIDDRVATVQTIVTAAQTATNSSDLDPTMQATINAALRLAMADAQAALDAKFDEDQKAALLQQFKEHKTAIADIGTQAMEAVVASAAKIKSHVTTIKSIVIDAWIQKNFNSSTIPEHGIILGQEALQGAREMFNEKYGEGSVYW
jgi:hypothetical protein